MSAAAVEVVKQAYEAFGRRDVPGVLNLVADQVDWRFQGAKRLPYTGAWKTKGEVARWFAAIAEVDDIQAFEPREFIDGGEHVTVIGWERTAARPGGRVFETEWVHVFTVRGGKVTRFWGIYDTEASAATRG
ncbi:MAG TPA: nuclear transport factor 2 family protein [Candidatus Acidoferrum sp.]|nr:nuclear transport factor 2 family protein [Candidatus Acidoferrum sp.]